jgi:integrase
MRYVVREGIYKKLVNRKWKEVIEVIIYRCEGEEDEVYMPSKFTEYLYTEFNGASINTKVKHAKTITAFLNYVIEQTRLGENSIYDIIREDGFYRLNHYHVTDFLNYLTLAKKNKRKTWMGKQKELIQFMWFLHRRGITGEEGKVESKVVEKRISNGKKNQRTNGRVQGVRVWINPFNDKEKYRLHIPPEGDSNVLKDLEQDEWEQLIEYAEKYHPRIAFGIAIQCMGGLRQGEVVNITLNDISFIKGENEDSIRDKVKIAVREHPELWEERKVATRMSQVKPKKTTTAYVHNFNGRLREMYDNHMKLRNELANEFSTKVGAFFVNSEGYPMTGNSYGSDYRRVRDAYIEELSKVKPARAEELKDKTWASHIGRHVFTNYLLKHNMVNDASGQPNPHLLKVARRDESDVSAADYIDERTVVAGVNKALGLMSKAALDRDGGANER